MSINAIRARLGTTLGAISGISRVYTDLPNTMPANPDMPCFILNMREPMVTVQSRTNSSVEYNWHFDLTCLVKSEGLGNPDENFSALEDFIKLTVDALFADFTGAGAWTLLNKDAGGVTALEFTGGILGQAEQAAESNRAWGFSGTLDVMENISTVMSAGS